MLQSIIHEMYNININNYVFDWYFFVLSCASFLFVLGSIRQFVVMFV